MVSDDKLGAYARGELDPAEAAEVEAAIFRDPGVAERLEQLRARGRKPMFDAGKAAEGARAAGSWIMRLLAPLAGPQPAYMRWVLMAGCLALGLLIGRLTDAAPLVRADAGLLRASPELARVLDRRISFAPDNERARLRVGQSIRSIDGSFCRTFAETNRGALSGLACRTEEAWVVRVIASGSATQSDFDGARFEAPAVQQVREALMIGAPLNEDEERAARRNGWRL